MSIHKLQKALSLALAFAVLSAFSASAVVTAPMLKSDKGMVAAAQPLAAAAGAEILEKGGNAIDAAIAVSLALGVVEPYASGLGGEGYMVVRMADGKTYSIDFRSTAPGMATYDRLKAEGPTIRDISRTSRGACVPGIPAAIEAIHAKGATLPLAELAAPAIRLAEEGFEVTSTFSKVCKDNFDVINANAPDYLNEGFAWEPGEVLKNPALAKTLRLLVEKGIREFYDGSIADDIDRYMTEKKGWLRKSDLQAYSVAEREPIVGSYKGYHITVAGLPVGGPRLLENLNIFEKFNFAAMGWDDPLRLHIMQETFLLTDTDLRTYIGDPAFNKTADKGLVNKDYAKSRMMRIKLGGATTFEEWEGGKKLAGEPLPYEAGATFKEQIAMPKAAELPQEELYESASTTHFSIIDRWGNAVAWTQTISSFFGTGCWVDGFFLNNEMGNFLSVPTGGMGDMVPGKRVRTTIAPMLIEKDGAIRWVLGKPGANRIVPTLTQMIVDMVDFGMTLEEAVKAPKIMSSFNTKGKTSLMEMESGYDAATVEALQKGFGYTVVTKTYPDLYFGGPNVIAREADGSLTGIGSVRRGGAAAAPEK